MSPPPASLSSLAPGPEVLLVSGEVEEMSLESSSEEESTPRMTLCTSHVIPGFHTILVTGSEIILLK